MPDFFLGKQLGEFFAEERIGRGGMAVVYRAFQPSVQRHVALKVIDLTDNMSDDDEFRLRFAQEAELIASLEHIHILPVYDYGIVNDEVAFIAMRLMRGGSLADFLKSGPLPIDRATDILTQVARGLAYAHAKGVVHRDLKPSNILFDASGNAYLTDFGLAKIVSMPFDITRPGKLVGTPAYVAPEALRGEPLDHRADIYSLGIMLYQLLTGRLPFELTDGNVMALIRQHLEATPTPPSQVNPLLSREVNGVVMRALAKHPNDRYQDAEALADALNAAVGRHLSTGSYAALSVMPPQRRLSAMVPRKPTGLWLLVLVLLALGGLAAYMAVTGERPLPPVGAVVAETNGTAADVAPSEEEISIARQRLAPEGFIAYIACTLDTEFQATRAREMRDLAEQYGLPYRVYDSDDDGYTQTTIIERARLEGAKAMIICPLATELLEPRLESLEQAGIPTVITTLFEAPYGVKLDSDNYETGFLAGEVAGRAIRDERGGEANVVILGFPGFPASEARARGLRDGVLEHAPRANIIGVYQGFTREAGYDSIKQLIDDGIEIDAIASMNDAGSFGAIDALLEAGYDPSDVIITSVNAETLAVEHVREGYFIRATVEIDRAAGSQLALNAAVKLLGGADVPETLIFPPGRVITQELLRAGE